LKNAVERAALVSSADSISDADLAFLGAEGSARGGGTGTLKNQMGKAEKETIRSVLERNGWNVSAAARALGMDRTHLHKKMSQLGLRAGRTGGPSQ